MPVWLEQLGKALPPLIMAVLIVYCLRDITTDPKHIGIAQMAGVLATAIAINGNIIRCLALYQVQLSIFA